MAVAVLTSDNTMQDGGVLCAPTAAFSNIGTYSSTAIIQTKVLLNRAHREVTTLWCNSSQTGTWVIYDVDEYGTMSQIASVAVTGGTLSIQSFNFVTHAIVCTFTPSAATAGAVVIRGYCGGMGMLAS